MQNDFVFKAKVWITPGPGVWHFVSVNEKLSDQIQELFGHLSRGWRSLPVEVQIGETKWKTSIFYETSSRSYILPLKTKVRKAEDIKDGKTIDINLKILA